MNTRPPPDPPGLSRRQFLIGAALLGIADAARAGTYRGAMPGSARAVSVPEAISGTGYVFFSNAEASFVEAAVARLIPSDALGPGALEAGCAVFMDRQLAGAYGRAETWYMQGPWPEGGEEQGFQSRMAPAEMYRAGIRSVDEQCRARFDGKVFKNLSLEDQDQVLALLEKGGFEPPGGKGFFALLLQNTIEGFFADPLYGGNRDMVGWKLIGFPGARYDYRDAVDRHGERYRLPPVSIMGRKAASPRS